MSGFRTAELSRNQIVLWQHRLDDAIPENHQVRHFEKLLGSQAFAATFREMERAYDLARGKPPYHPRDLAGLYLFGMLHGIRSSRKLEEACFARLDVIWLMQTQTPDHSTIAEFVTKHGDSLRRLFRDALRVLIDAKLVKLSHVSIDGTKIEADAGRNSVRSEEKIRSWLKHVDENIAALEREWRTNEKRETNLFGQSNPWTSSAGKGATGKDAAKSWEQLKRKQEDLKRALAQLERRQAEHVSRKPFKRVASTTDADARVMKDKEGRSKPNYNTQLAVDDACGAIVAAEVNDAADDSGQLIPMVEQVIENCSAKPESVTADSQYNTGPDLAAMEELQIDGYLPDSGCRSKAESVPKTAEEAAAREAADAALAQARAGRPLSEAQWSQLPRNKQKKIDRSAFVYDADEDEYRCPAGQTLVLLRTNRDKKKWGTAERKQYGGAACSGCAHAALCCKDAARGRTINRDQYEEHRERLRARMASAKGAEIYKLRKQTVEPRIGHVKHNMGVRRFLRRGIEQVRTEWRMVCAAANVGILLRHWEEVAKLI